MCPWNKVFLSWNQSIQFEHWIAIGKAVNWKQVCFKIEAPNVAKKIEAPEGENNFLALQIAAWSCKTAGVEILSMSLKLNHEYDF